MTSIRLAPNGTHFILQTKNEMGVEIPISATGAEIIARILRAQEMAPRPKIATPSFPTQHLVNQWKKEDAARKAAEAKQRFAAMGLDDLEIDL